MDSTVVEKNIKYGIIVIEVPRRCGAIEKVNPMSMRKTLVAVALAFMCISPAFADKAADEAKIRDYIAQKDRVIEVTREWRTNACAKRSMPSKEVCERMYDLLIQRRLAERATFEVWLKALQLDLEPQDRSFILLTVVPSEEFDATEAKTNLIAKQIDRLYPQPPKKSASKK